MSINIKLVAQKANVAVSTVSRVLNNSGYASEETKEKVLTVVKELGYRQNNVARSLRKKASSFIGLIVPDISNEFYSILAKSIEHVLQKEGFSLFLCNTEEDEDREQFYIDSLLDNQVSGLILAPTNFHPTPRLLKSGIPLVLFDKMASQFQNSQIAFIESDNFDGAKQAGDLLFQQGATRLACLQGSKPIHSMTQRREGFLRAMHDHDLSPDCYQIHEISVSPRIALHHIQTIYREFPFDGLFCCTDSIAIGAIHGLRDLGLAIPENIQVIGFDGIALGEYLNPSLSTIKQDIKRMGQLAGEKILKMVAGMDVKEHVVLPTTFIRRRSTR